MIDVVDRDHPGAVNGLRVDALTELQRWTEINVRFVADGQAEARCSVAGSYQGSATPPLLQVAMSASQRRRQFTVLHELGHHLQQTDLALGQAVLDVPDSEAFEDAACDAFAARVLIPDSMVAGRIGARGPTAEDVLAFYDASRASRAACCVRAAEHLAGFGVVVLFEASGVVNFAAARGTVPPARGSDQSHTPLLAALLARGPRSGVVTRTTHIRYRTGHTSEELYGQAAWCDGYIVAVLAEDTAGWQSFSPPRPGTTQFGASKWEACETCGEEFPVTDSCPVCRDPRCPHGHCQCTQQRERTCPGCYTVRHRSQFSPGSAVCRTCTE